MCKITMFLKDPNQYSDIYVKDYNAGFDSFSIKSSVRIATVDLMNTDTVLIIRHRCSPSCALQFWSLVCVLTTSHLLTEVRPGSHCLCVLLLFGRIQ